jgi:hypothetical protein
MRERGFGFDLSSPTKKFWAGPTGTNPCARLETGLGGSRRGRILAPASKRAWAGAGVGEPLRLETGLRPDNFGSLFR